MLDLHLAADKIYKQTNENSFEADVHPMLYEVSDLSFDIAGMYRSDEDDKTDWDVITKTIKNYTAGEWESTCWILSAMYGEYADKQLTHSYSAAIRRQNGETIIETAAEEIKDKLNKYLLKFAGFASILYFFLGWQILIAENYFTTSS